MHGRLHHVILDCPEPREPAEFYSALLGQPVTYDRAPTWPDPTIPQQIHLDVMVENLAEAEPFVLGLGATSLAGDGVFADPAGHPFCLIAKPGWAPPLAD